MRRREFIALAGAAAVWPVAARAQQSVSKMPRIGIMDPAVMWDHFRQGLRDLGYIEGRDIVIDYRSAEARPEQLVAVATELAQLPVDIIVTFGSARPADLPVEQPTKFELVVNLRTARGDATRHARGSARPRSDNRGPQCQH